MKKLFLCAAVIVVFLLGVAFGTFRTIKLIKVINIDHGAVSLDVAGNEHVYMFEEMEG